jgi:uncharacterized damage-inducible protein DinB
MESMSEIAKQVVSAAEPWLRGTWAEVPAVARAVLHALQLAKEDLEKWCGDLTDEELNGRPAGLPPVAFHLRHIARSTDRLLTYAEAGQLSDEQLVALKSEMEPGAQRTEVFEELIARLDEAAARIRVLAERDLGEARSVGKKQLPATLGGLLVHVAEHTQRHVGQAITTAKMVVAGRMTGTRE